MSRCFEHYEPDERDDALVRAQEIDGVFVEVDGGYLVMDWSTYWIWCKQK